VRLIKLSFGRLKVTVIVCRGVSTSLGSCWAPLVHHFVSKRNLRRLRIKIGFQESHRPFSGSSSVYQGLPGSCFPDFPVDPKSIGEPRFV
jgi:hypothetical protein